MEKLFNFKLTIQEAQLVVAGIRKLPMEVAEQIVQNLEKQFTDQTTDNAPKVVEQPLPMQDSAKYEAEQVPIKKSRKASN